MADDRRDSFALERDDYRLMVSEHHDQAFVSIDGRGGQLAILLGAAELVTAAGRMLEMAERIINRQAGGGE